LVFNSFSNKGYGISTASGFHFILEALFKLFGSKLSVSLLFRTFVCLVVLHTERVVQIRLIHFVVLADMTLHRISHYAKLTT
jgi:hypothetical protein